jgi:acyl-CoA reductase-like NAD-dependent aldehyde dehydrogenase
VLRWDTEDEVVTRANNSDTGLGASVWTKDLGEAKRIAVQLDTGSV